MFLILFSVLFGTKIGPLRKRFGGKTETTKVLYLLTSFLSNLLLCFEAARRLGLEVFPITGVSNSARSY